MIELNSSVVTIKTKDDKKMFKLNVDDGTVVYMKKVKTDEDILEAIQKSIQILKAFPEYSNYITELEAALL